MHPFLCKSRNFYQDKHSNLSNLLHSANLNMKMESSFMALKCSNTQKMIMIRCSTVQVKVSTLSSLYGLDTTPSETLSNDLVAGKASSMGLSTDDDRFITDWLGKEIVKKICIVDW